jgi:hypothetical protein
MQGGLAFFIEFLKLSEVCEKLVEDCPLNYVSTNASSQSEILGSEILRTILLSVLSRGRSVAPVAGDRAVAQRGQLTVGLREVERRGADVVNGPAEEQDLCGATRPAMAA